MTKKEYERLSYQLEHLKIVTNNALKSLELNLKSIENLEAQLQEFIHEERPTSPTYIPPVSQVDVNSKPSDLIRMKEVIRMTGFSRSTIYLKMKKRDFPQAISLGCRSIAWLRKDVKDWILSKVNTSRKLTE